MPTSRDKLREISMSETLININKLIIAAFKA